MRSSLFVVCLFGWLLQAHATELGLDLTEEPDSSGERFAPSLAFVGIQAVGKRQTDRIKRLTTEFQRDLNAAVQAGRFSRLLGPKEVLPALKELKKTHAECRDLACMALLAETLGVDRIISGALTPSGPGSLLTLWGYEPTAKQLITETAESPEREQQQQTSGFMGLMKPSKTKTEAEFSSRTRNAWMRIMASLGVGLGKLTVDAVESSTKVSLSGQEIGSGSFEILLERGHYSLLAEAEGFLPFNADITIRPHQVELVRVLMVAKPLDRSFDAQTWKESDSRQNKPIYTHPGLYVAIAGAAVMGVGIASLATNFLEPTIGPSAKLVSWLIVAGGGAMLTGGTIWMFAAPGKIAENPLDVTRVGVVIGIGGTF